MTKRTLFTRALLAFFMISISQNALSDPIKAFQQKLTQYQGKVVYVDFWASWCGPCRKSFPWMNNLKKTYQAQGFEIVSINLDRDLQLAEKFLAHYPASFDVIYDPNGLLAKKYHVKGMPSSFILNRKSEVTSVHVGFTKQKSQQYQQEILTLLAQ